MEITKFVKSLFIVLLIFMANFSMGNIFKENRNENLKNEKDDYWPQFLHDAKHTGRSSYSKTISEKILWKYYVGVEEPGTVHISTDIKGNIYFNVRDTIFILYPNGLLKMKIDKGEFCPAIGDNGTIYVVYSPGYSIPMEEHPKPRYLYGFDKNGNMILNVTFLPPTATHYFMHPVIGKNEIIYLAGYNESLYAVSPNGRILWNLTIYPQSIPSIGDDGTIYVPGFKYFYAVNPDGSIKWRYPIGSVTIDSIPSIGDDGTVYVPGGNYFYAFNPNGTLKWKSKKGAWIYHAIGPDGTLYYMLDGVVAVNPKNGFVKWEVNINASRFPTYHIVGGDGTVYVGAGHFLYAISSEGKIKWKVHLDNPVIYYSSLAVGRNGTIYVATKGGYIYAIGGEENTHSVTGMGNIYFVISATVCIAVIIIATVWIWRWKKGGTKI